MRWMPDPIPVHPHLLSSKEVIGCTGIRSEVPQCSLWNSCNPILRSGTNDEPSDTVYEDVTTGGNTELIAR